MVTAVEILNAQDEPQEPEALDEDARWQAVLAQSGGAAPDGQD